MEWAKNIEGNIIFVGLFRSVCRLKMDAACILNMGRVSFLMCLNLLRKLQDTCYLLRVNISKLAPMLLKVESTANFQFLSGDGTLTEQTCKLYNTYIFILIFDIELLEQVEIIDLINDYAVQFATTNCIRI